MTLFTFPKMIVHPKITNLSWFILHHVVSNMWLTSKRKYCCPNNES